MELVAVELERLRHLLESTAFLVGNGGSPQRIHSELVQGLILVSKLQNLTSAEAPRSAISDQSAKEVRKVARRLKLWAKRQHHINARILNAFLKLQRAGAVPITERDIKSELPDLESFESNFNQMKIISEKNHGKVFEQDGDVVVLWQPIVSYVREYERLQQR